MKKDIVKGDGAEAKHGDTIKVEYVGEVYATGNQFGSSWGASRSPSPSAPAA